MNAATAESPELCAACPLTRVGRPVDGDDEAQTDLLYRMVGREAVQFCLLSAMYRWGNCQHASICTRNDCLHGASRTRISASLADASVHRNLGSTSERSEAGIVSKLSGGQP